MKTRKLMLKILLSVALIIMVLNVSCTLAAGGRHTVGILPDGTVVAKGNNDEGQCSVSGWSDIVHVAAGFSHTVGLRDDRTVVATGRNIEGQCNVLGWTDISMVFAGDWHTVGLKDDGHVVATGKNDEGQCDVGGWTNITQVAAGGWHTVGLKDCGTVVATGLNNDGQCDVGGWILDTLSDEPPGTYHLTISSTAGGLATAPGEGVFAYCESEVVNLVAEAGSGSRFCNWT